MSDNIATLWAANPADVVLYMLGMNDAIAGTDPAITAANVAATIDYIHAQSPATRVYVLGPTNATTTHPDWNALLDAQRPNNQAIVATRSSWCGYIAMPHLADNQMDGGPHPVDHAAYALLSEAIMAVLP